MNLREQLEPFDWEALEARFVVQIEECEHEEERIGEEFKGWVEVCFPFFTWEFGLGCFVCLGHLARGASLLCFEYICLITCVV